MKTRFSIVAIVALFLSGLLVPVPVSSNQESVAKNFTITGWDDAPVANASVALFWSDGQGGSLFSEIKLTDELGQVSISIPKNAGNYLEGSTELTSLTYGVVPPVGDPKGNAAYSGSFGPADSSVDQSLSVKLNKSDLLIEILDTDGSPVKPVSQDPEPVIYVTEKTSANLGPIIAGPGKILRAGPFGLSLPNLDSAKTYEVGLFRNPPLNKTNRFSWRYAFTIQNSQNSNNFSFFTDRTASVPLAPSTDGIYRLEYKSGIVNFLSADGSPFVSGTAVVAKLCSVENSNNCYNFQVDSKGNAYYAQITGIPVDGNYVFSVNNVSYAATVSKGILSLEGENKNQDGTYSIKLAAPNLKVRATTQGANPTNINDARVEIRSGAEAQNFVAFGVTGSTFAGFTLPDREDYWLIVSPPFNLEGQFAKTQIPFKVLGGAATFEGLQAIDGVFSIPLVAPNFKFKLTGPDGQALRSSGRIDYCKTDISFNRNSRFECNGAGVNSQTALGGVSLTDGSYLIDVRPGDSFDGQEASKTVKASVQGGVVSIEGVQKNSENVFVLSSDNANAGFVFKDANGPITVGPSDWGISYRLQKKNGDFVGYVDYWSRSNQFAFKINEIGTYRVEAEFYRDNGKNVVLAYSPEFTYENGNFSTSGKTELTSLMGENRLDLLKAAENFQVQLVNPENPNATLSTQNIAFISRQCGERCYINEGLPRIRFDGSGKGGVSLPLETDQTFYLDVNHENFANKVYTIKVLQGQVTLEYEGQPVAKDGEGRFVIAPSIANVTGKVLDKDGLPLVLGDQKWINAQVEQWSEQQGWQPVIFARTNVNAQGEFKLRVNEQGRYRVWVEPFGYEQYGQMPSQEFELKSDGFYIGDKAKLPSLTGENRLEVKLLATNFKFKLVNPNSETAEGMNGWIGVQKENSDGNFTWLQGIGVNSTGLGGANLLDGKYRIEVNVNGFARKFYDLVVSNSGLNLVLKDGNTLVEQVSGRFPLKPATANLNGTVKDSAGGEIVVSPGTWISVNLQQWDENEQFWQWTSNWTGVSNSGSFVFNVDAAGKYRLMAIPNGIDGLSTNFSGPFEFTNGTFSELILDENTKLFSVKPGTTPAATLSINIKLAAPNFLINVVDPSKNNSPITQAWLSIFREIEPGGRSEWITNIDINSASQGKGGAKLEDGSYRVEVNTNLSGLSRSLYNVNVNGLSIEVKKGQDSITQTNDGRFTLAPSLPNLKGRALSSNGLPLAPGNNRWVQINLQKFNSTKGYWEWTSNWSNTTQDGSFGIDVTEAGRYRLRIEPYGFTGVTITNSIEFIVSVTGGALSFKYQSGSNTVESPTLNLGDITMGSPALLVKVAASEQSQAPLSHIGIEIRRNGAQIDWAGTGPSALASLSFSEEGNYEIILHPGPNQISQGLARKSYKVTVTKNQGALKGVVDGLTAQGDGAFLLYLGSANLKGIVRTPDVNNDPSNPGAPIRDIQVVAQNKATGQDLWDNQAQSGADGRWAMSLPDGIYTIRAVIWRSTLYTSSEPFGDVEVSGGAVKVPGSANPLDLTLKLTEPRWKGQVLSPDNQPVPFARINLIYKGAWYGTDADAQGRFALSIPAFDNFSTGDFIEIRDDRNGAFPMRRLQKQKDSDPELSTYFQGTGCETGDLWKTCKSVVLKFQKSNTMITVSAGGQPASNVWVNIDADNVGWLGGGVTNANGVASFNLDGSALIGGNLRIRAELNGNPQWSSAFTSTTETVNQSEVSSALSGDSKLYEKTVNLASPNFRAQLREPNQGATASWAWVELFNKETGEWVQGAGTDSNGLFTMNVPIPGSGSREYLLVVNPSWNSNAGLSRNQYKVLASKTDNAGSIQISKNVPEDVKTTIINSLNYFELELAEPSVRGVVKKEEGIAVRDSWVTPIDDLTGEYMWQYGANTKQDGSFALALPKDGKYRIEANVPWGVSGLARSSQCIINVSGGKVVSQDTTCVLTSNVVQLSLRSPNLTMTLKKAIGVNVPFAWVGVCIDRWCSGGQSGLDGKVSIFIDRDAVNQANGWSAQSQVTRPINVFVDPPWGSSDIVRFTCQSKEQKPVCDKLEDFNSDAEFPLTAVGDVQFGSPNLNLFVQKPDGSPLAFAWVNLFAAGGAYLGGSNTNAEGKASFNVTDSYYNKDDLSDSQFKFKVEINPPWNASTSYSRVVYGEGSSALLFSQVKDMPFKIGSPNIVVRVKTSIDSVWNKWGWVSLERDLSTDNWIWLGGFGLDVNGRTALTLEPVSKYRLIAYPGPGATGARRTCLFDTVNVGTDVKVSALTGCVSGEVVTDSDASTPDLLNLSLNSGNIAGRLMFGVTPVSDALVYAVPVKLGLTGSVSKNTVTGVTNTDGLQVGMKLTKTDGVGDFGGVAVITEIQGTTLTFSSDAPTTEGEVTFRATDEAKKNTVVSGTTGSFSLLLDLIPNWKWRIVAFPVRTIDGKTLGDTLVYQGDVKDPNLGETDILPDTSLAEK